MRDGRPIDHDRPPQHRQSQAQTRRRPSQWECGQRSERRANTLAHRPRRCSDTRPPRPVRPPRLSVPLFLICYMSSLTMLTPRRTDISRPFRAKLRRSFATVQDTPVRRYGGLKDQDRIFTNAYCRHGESSLFSLRSTFCVRRVFGSPCFRAFLLCWAGWAAGVGQYERESSMDLCKTLL